MGERYGDFPCNLCLHRCIDYSIINIIHQNNTFFTKDEALLTHQRYLKSIVNVILSLCCTLYGFEKKKCNDTYPSLSYHTEYFIELKILCGLPIYHPRPAPDNHWSFYCLYSLYFSRMSCSWNHIICSLFRLASFTLQFAFKVPLCLVMT